MSSLGEDVERLLQLYRETVKLQDETIELLKQQRSVQSETIRIQAEHIEMLQQAVNGRRRA